MAKKYSRPQQPEIKAIALALPGPPILCSRLIEISAATVLSLMAAVGILLSL